MWLKKKKKFFFCPDYRGFSTYYSEGRGLIVTSPTNLRILQSSFQWSSPVSLCLNITMWQDNASYPWHVHDLGHSDIPRRRRVRVRALIGREAAQPTVGSCLAAQACDVCVVGRHVRVRGDVGRFLFKSKVMWPLITISDVTSDECPIVSDAYKNANLS